MQIYFGSIIHIYKGKSGRMRHREGPTKYHFFMAMMRKDLRYDPEIKEWWVLRWTWPRGTQNVLHCLTIKTKKKKPQLESEKAKWVPLDTSRLYFSENAVIISPPKKKPTVQPGDAIEDTDFKPGFEIVKSSTTVLWSPTSSLLCKIDTTSGFLISSAFG